MLLGLPIHLERRLQSVQNAAAWLICRLRRFDHVIDALVSLIALAARPGARRLQDRRANVQGSAWDRTGVSRTSCSCRRSAWSNGLLTD